MAGRDRGFALLIVAIALAALSLIFAAAIGTTRQHLTVTTANLTHVRLSAAIDGAVATVAYDLATARTAEPAVLVAPQTIDIGGVPVTVAARPEAAKLDLNAAAPALLYRYFVVSGIPDAAAKDLTEAILRRRRDADPAYAKAHDKARADPFESVSEAFALKGVTDDIADCIEPDLTVFTGLSTIEADTASDRVREADGLPAQAPQPVAGAATAGRSIVAGEIFEITAHAHDDASGLNLSRQTVLRMTGNVRTPVWILAVTTPAPDPQKAQEACDRIKRPPQTATADNVRR